MESEAKRQQGVLRFAHCGLNQGSFTAILLKGARNHFDRHLHRLFAVLNKIEFVAERSGRRLCATASNLG
jgi:hypothetical protein